MARKWKSHNPHKVYHMDTRATFSKKYPGKRISDLWADDPDYLLYCHETLELKMSPEVTELLRIHKTQKARRGITKVTRFKSNGK